MTKHTETTGTVYKKWSIWLLAATLIVLVFITHAYLAQRLPDFFYYEDFTIFQFADTYNHFDAWRAYFFQFGRFFEGIYWTYLYKMIGNSPAAMHAISLCLHLLSVLFASWALLRVWPSKSRFLPQIGFGLVLLLFFNRYSLELTFRLASDNNRIALILFWLSVLAFQQWAASAYLRYWLVMGLVLFTISLNTYENIAFYFPIAMMLSWPLRPTQGSQDERKTALRFILLCVIGSLLIFIPYFIYYRIEQLEGTPLRHPAMITEFSLTKILLILFNALIKIGSYFRVFGQSNWEGIAILEQSHFFVFLAVLLLSICQFWKRYLRMSNPRISRQLLVRDSLPFVFLAGIWLFFVGFLPFGLIGYQPFTRVYSAAVFGFPVLFLASIELIESRLYQLAIVLIAIIFMGYSVYHFHSVANSIRSWERPDNTFYVSLKELVPQVKERTNFILINYTGNGYSCNESMTMLYGKADLTCVTIGSSDQRFRADRYAGVIHAHYGGWLRNGNDVILRYENGVLSILPEITPNDDLLINWFVDDPIVTDYKRIIYEDPEPPRQFYTHLIKRREILGLNEAR